MTSRYDTWDKSEGSIKFVFRNDVNDSNGYNYIVTKEGDRLDLLADRYFNDARLWWIIARANALDGDSVFIAPAFRLRIPINYIAFLQE